MANSWVLRVRIQVGIIGIVFGLLLSSFMAWQTFLQPRAPFASYAGDRLIALIYLLIFLVAGLLTFFNGGRVLRIVACALAGTLIFVAARSPEIAISLLLLTWILGLSWGMGRLLFKRIAPRDRVSVPEGEILSLALGWGALMVLMLLLGVVGLYVREILYGVLGILSGVVIFLYYKSAQISQTIKRFSPRLRARSMDQQLPASLALYLMVILAAGNFLWALAPAVRYDALSYHLAAPMRYLNAGRMIELPESSQSYSAQYGEMLYTAALGLGEQPLPTLLNFTAGLLLAAQTYFIGRKLGNHTTGLIAAVLLYSLPIIGSESATAYTDIFVAVFVTAVIQIFLHWREKPENHCLLLMGIFSGLALGTKLNALFLLLPIWVWAFISEIRSSQIKSTVLWAACRRVFFMGLPALLLWIPWLLRDYLWTGNPIFPNYNQLFHSPNWFDTSFFRIQPTRGIALRMLAFPWMGIIDSYRYYHEAPGAVLGAIPLLGLPWLYRVSALWGWSVSGLAALVMIFAYGGSARYVLPLLPLVSALAAINIGELLSTAGFLNTNVPRAKKNPRRLVQYALLTLCLVYLFSTRLAFTVRWWEIPERYPVGIWMGTETQAEFVHRILPVYGAFEFLDQQGQFKVFSVGNELRLYTNSAIYGPLFSKEAYELLHTSETPAALAENLAQNEYDYILLFPPEVAHRPEVYASPALSEEFFNQFTTQVYAQRDVYLYALNP